MAEEKKTTWPVMDPGDGRNPVYFDNPMIDALVSVSMELGAAQWVQHERLRIIEKLLTEKGVVTTEMIEKYVPSDADRAAAKTERDAFIGRIYGAFSKLQS
ncbi:MAG: hypothetical protein SFV19_03065 [Rhodospirillaceae bacterium]|nr:hypothetical protein [Rhodospirillaceae bacterium]